MLETPQEVLGCLAGARLSGFDVGRLDGCRGDLARQSDRTISEIAFAWGFSSSAHFSRAFRKRFGVTPTAFRRGDRGTYPG